jgi:hypothetical protein
MMRRVVLVLVVFIMAAGAAFADRNVGKAQWLHEKWVGLQQPASSSSVDLAIYDTFVMGVAQTAESSLLNVISIPKGTTLGQVFGAVGSYLESHPEEWSLDAGAVVIKALRAVFPAKR